MTTNRTLYDASLVKPRPKGWLRFLHTADWHWGFSGTNSRFGEFTALKINKTDDLEYNIRMLDIQKAMEQIPQIAREFGVDMVLNAGDSWDSWGYRRSYINNVYTDVLHAIADHNIQYVEVIGNHDLPNEITMGPHLRSVRHIPNVHVVYQSQYEQVKFKQLDTVIHAVPSPKMPELIHSMLREITRIDGMMNIGMSHTGVTTIPHYAHNANGVVVELDQLIACRMDYFALGDFHTPKDLGHGIHYSGAIERFGYDEIGNKPQVKIVDMNPDTKEQIVTPVFLGVRPMIDLPAVDAKGLDIEPLNNSILHSLSSTDITDKIVRLKILNLDISMKPYIDFRKIKELTRTALHFEPKYIDATNKLKETQIELEQMGSLPDIWTNFAKNYAVDAKYREAFEKEGRKGLEDAIDELTIT